MSAATDQPVIIVKKKGRHRAGHHGGAWKVAYADFVTAMMAFFMVMWLVGQGAKVRESVGQYFRDPGAFAEGGSGLLPGVQEGVLGGERSGGPRALSANVEEAKRALEQAAVRLRGVVQSRFSDVVDRVDIQVTDEGLRIELRDVPDDGFFSSGSAAMKEETETLLAAIASELGQLGNKVAVEGHTDSRPYASRAGYTNWELSADRANAARRVLERTGVTLGQMEEVRGYADRRPRFEEDPLNAGNRRISIVVRRLDATS